ncbi:MAG: 30S ribosomal protein S19 [Planctomycetes bacterium]|nr:30S ribosomal protein S19 [Planctomycetota bacterium]
MGRSLKKGPFVDAKVMKHLKRRKEQGSKEPITTWARASTVVPDMVGYTFMVHNGRIFHKVYVTEELVGHKLGEFAPTRTYRGHSQKK